jgi:hypothetical protein
MRGGCGVDGGTGTGSVGFGGAVGPGPGCGIGAGTSPSDKLALPNKMPQIPRVANIILIKVSPFALRPGLVVSAALQRVYCELAPDAAGTDSTTIL